MIWNNSNGIHEYKRRTNFFHKLLIVTIFNKLLNNKNVNQIVFYKK